MDGEPQQPETQLHGSGGNRFDALVRDFETAWNEGRRPRIEDYLAQVPPDGRGTAFAELLQRELAARQRLGETLAPDPYKARFAEFDELIRRAFPNLQPQRRRLGDYELLDELGHGGMGVVYKARQVLLDQVVAVKVLPDRYLQDASAVARFKREMKLIGRLDHPHIVRAFNAGEDKSGLYLVMEYVDGVNFHDLIVQLGALPVEAACELIRQAALGLQGAHQHGLVHRDVKPANLMLSREGVVKILDLGLARLHSGQYTQELTATGVAMGTVDYMAPEQWESTSDVDIRADIYSLGCTLYFLLTGEPPYGDEQYSSHRKKLLAHAAAPVPQIRAVRPESPPQVQLILQHMLAKDLDDRIPTPAEVAEALEPWSDPESPKRTIRRLEWGQRSQATADLSMAAGADTRRRHSKSSAGGSKWRSAMLAERRRRILLYSGMMALGILLGILLWRPWRDKPGVPVGPSQTDGAATQVELALLPDLNGGWWFDQMPWLVPFVRQALAADAALAGELAAAEPGGLLAHPNVDRVEETLLQGVGRIRQRLSVSQQQLVDELMAVARENLLDADVRKRLTDSLARFQDSAGDPQKWSAVDAHAIAVLRHKLASLGGDQDMADRARQAYDQALSRYAEGGGATLRRLCLSDCGNLVSQYLGGSSDAKQRYDEARKRFDDARAGLNQAAVLFQVDVLVNLAGAASAAATEAAEYGPSDHAVLTALELLEKSGLANRNHPLVAYAHETYAWNLADRWMIDKAREEFVLAEHVRDDNSRHWENDTARIHLFHNRHGRAIVERYRGNAAGARAEFDNLLEDIRQALRTAEQQSGRIAQQRFRHDLRERLYNSSERRADCELYQGAASSAASVNLRKACDLYQQARENAEDPRVRVAMAYKQVIALALAGRTEQARKELDAETNRASSAGGSEEERNRLLLQVAQAVLTLKEQGAAAGQAVLRKFLDQFELGLVSIDRRKRENLELQLLCVELLLSAASDKAAGASGNGDLRHLDKVLSVFPAGQQMLPFVRRCYDLAVRMAEPGDADRVLGYVLASRGKPAVEPNTALLAFHVLDQRAVAVLRAPDQPTALFLLPGVGRKTIKEAGGPLKLPDGLVQAIKRQQTSGRRFTLLWSDEMCFAAADAALSDRDWPFAEQLDLAALRPAKAK